MQEVPNSENIYLQQKIQTLTKIIIAIGMLLLFSLAGLVVVYAVSINSNKEQEKMAIDQQNIIKLSEEKIVSLEQEIKDLKSQLADSESYGLVVGETTKQYADQIKEINDNNSKLQSQVANLQETKRRLTQALNECRQQH